MFKVCVKILPQTLISRIFALHKFSLIYCPLARANFNFCKTEVFQKLKLVGMFKVCVKMLPQTLISRIFALQKFSLVALRFFGALLAKEEWRNNVQNCFL